MRGTKASINEDTHTRTQTHKREKKKRRRQKAPNAPPRAGCPSTPTVRNYGRRQRQQRQLGRRVALSFTRRKEKRANRHAFSRALGCVEGRWSSLQNMQQQQRGRG